jgi:hypothetical protein
MSSSRRSSSNISITYSSPRTSSSSLSSQSSSGRTSTYNNYRTSVTSTMGKSASESERRTERNLRVVDPRSKNCLPITAQGFSADLFSAPRADTITYRSCGPVSVINHEKRREDKSEPRSSDARSSDYYNSSSNRHPRK